MFGPRRNGLESHKRMPDIVAKKALSQTGATPALPQRRRGLIRLSKGVAQGCLGGVNFR
jgi:hypothetical protein